MLNIYRNKFIGTGVFIVVVSVFSLTAFSFAQAQLTSTRSGVNVDGIVSGVSSSTITVQTAGTEPIEIGVGAKTIFAPSATFADVQVGDQVNIIARNDRRNPSVQMPQAQIVRLTDAGPGYGTTGDTVLITQSPVTAINGSVITVDNGASQVHFKVLTSTKIIGSRLSVLSVGDRVTVVGEDVGTHFVARTISIMRR